ncbi:thiol-disulfide isomerase/thioredoxin [Parvibaculum indicum]|uniref:TlpA family protein disulfide reductase n=1 Tax=Parvibaculum indicum TaxID=562969 RepID=UPI0014222BB7|nr:TlpA disulfide reductase family protein [Parvibaculum indicum]NIJ41442.1 thiol-disulfide isomerase/thioredoxin [Parvibaculum indicum]
MSQKSRNLPKLAAAFVAAAVLVVAGIYLIVGPLGKSGAEGEAGPAGVPNPHYAALEAAATGEVAAFVPSKTLKPVPDVVFQDGKGKPVKLSDFRGKTLLLNVWATWCAPCREEMPELDKLQGEMGGDSFQVLALSVDRQGLERARDFLDNTVKAQHLALYNDPKSSANFQLRAVGLPTTLLVDPQGREMGRISGPAPWDGRQALALIRAALGQ